MFPTFKNRIAVYLFAFDHLSVILDLVKWFCVGDLGQQSADLRSACGNCWRAPSQRWNDGVSVAEKMFQGHAESCLTVQRISNLSSTISLLLTKGQHTRTFLLGLNLPLNSQRLRLDPPSVTDYCYHVLFFFLSLLLSNAQKGTARVNTVDTHRQNMPVYWKEVYESCLYSSVSAGLAVGLGLGAIAEVAKKSLKPQQQGDDRSISVFSDGPPGGVLIQCHLYWILCVCVCVSQAIRSPSWTRVPSSPKPTLRESSGLSAKSEAPLSSWGRCSVSKVKYHQTASSDASQLSHEDTRTSHARLRHVTDSKSTFTDRSTAARCLTTRLHPVSGKQKCHLLK